MAKREASIRTDVATAVDGLGFAPYRETLLEVIRTAETPLTIGVFGDWGSGKTSLLRMLGKALEKGEGPKAEEGPAARIVWFNAWQYPQQEALWRALLSRVLEALRRGEVEEAGEGKAAKAAVEKARKLEQELDDLQASLYRVVEREETTGFEVDWTKLVKGGVKGAIKVGVSFLPGGKVVEDLAEMTKEGAKPAIKELLEAFQREKTKQRYEQLRFLEQFRERFEKLMAARVAAEGERLVVFIDDLDRCLPERAIEVLEAVKLFLDVEECVFVIAADRRVIVKGIEVRYGEFAAAKGGDGELPIRGEDYLEKIIQLPFNLPPVRDEDMVAFIAKQVEDLPEPCAKVFSLGVEANPRKIKRALNVFWMHDRLASHRPELKEVIRPVRLAKVVVIQESHPDFYAAWVRAPLLLRHLEEHFLRERARREEGEPAGPAGAGAAEAGGEAEKEAEAVRGRTGTSRPARGAPVETLVERWATNRALRKMLLYGAGEEGMGFAGMEQAELEEYIYLTRASAVSAAEPSEALDEELWQALLSGDRTVAESAVGKVKAEERRSYARRLLREVETGETAKRRAAAGMAVGFLGDPRFRADAWGLPDEELLGFVEIPQGPFEMGTEAGEIPDLVKRYGGKRQWYEPEAPRSPVDLPAFWIARYPVTVQQFRTFVEASGHEPRDPDSLEGAPNHPVVLVTWHDGLAYCQWLQERLASWEKTPGPLAERLRRSGWRVLLPSEAEWEKAARGQDRRQFPWGDEPAPERANYDETGIGATSAAGCFPAGESSYGVLDLGGNVWEWTRSLWGTDPRKPSFPYPYDAADGREELEATKDVRRVLRGGSFAYGRRFARCSYRNRVDPVDHDWDFGFRVVLSPFSSGV